MTGRLTQRFREQAHSRELLCMSFDQFDDQSLMHEFSPSQKRSENAQNAKSSKILYNFFIPSCSFALIPSKTGNSGTCGRDWDFRYRLATTVFAANQFELLTFDANVGNDAFCFIQ